MNKSHQEMLNTVFGDETLSAQLLATVYRQEIGIGRPNELRDLAIHFTEVFGMDNINPQRMMRALRNVKAVA